MKKSSSSSSLAVEHSLLFETRSFALTIISDGCCYCRFFFFSPLVLGLVRLNHLRLLLLIPFCFTNWLHIFWTPYAQSVATVSNVRSFSFGLSHSVALRHTTPPNNQRMCSILIHESIKRRICACADRFTRNASKGKKGYTFLSISCFGPHRPYDTFHFHTAWPFSLILSLFRCVRCVCSAQHSVVVSI